MKAYWTDTKPNGQPLNDGRVCYVIDPEDGTNPQYVYGKDAEEVTEKLALNNVHAQRTLQQRAAAPTPAPGPTPVPAATRPRLTDDQRARATADVTNPARSGEALAMLVEDATGIDLNKLALRNFADMSMQWQNAHPEFYPSMGNKRLLVDQAKAHVEGGQLSRITAEILTQSFTELSQGGYLQEAPPDFQPQLGNPPVHPGQNPAQRTERPRGAQFATGTRSTSFRAPQSVSTRTIKYTADEIRRMPESKSKALIESEDRDYAEACEFHFGDTRNTA